MIPQILKMSCSDKDLDIIDTLITKIDSKPIIENSIFMMSHNVQYFFSSNSFPNFHVLCLYFCLSVFPLKNEILT